MPGNEGMHSVQPGESRGCHVTAWTWDGAGKFSVLGTALEQWCRRSQLWEMVSETSCRAGVLDSSFQKMLLLFPEVRECISRDGVCAQTLCQAQKIPHWDHICIQAACSEVMLG